MFKLLFLLLIFPSLINYTRFGFQKSAQRFEVFSVAWKPNQRRVFETVGHLARGKWKLTQPVFPNEQYGFNRRHFKVVTNLVS